MKVLLGIPLTAAASGPSVLEIGLADIHFISTVAPAMPDMKSFFLSHIRQNCQHPKASAHPVFQGRLLPAAAAAGISCDQPPFRCLDHISAVTLAKPERIPVLSLISGLSENRQFSKSQTGQILPYDIGRLLTATAVDHPRLQPPALHQDFLPAVASAFPDHCIADPLICRL